MKYIKKFNSMAEYEAAELSYPATSLVSGTVIYDKEAPAPPTPTFEGKWLATYSDSHTESGECDASSAITDGEINKTNLVSVEIGDCVTSIGDYAFVMCSSLTSVTIGSGVTSIGNSAFYSCSSLTSITIPDSVISIGSGAFDETPWWSSYSADTNNHYGNIVYINNVAYAATAKTITSCTFKEGTISIGDSAFYGCRSLTSITIPDGVASISTDAFTNCSSLTNVTIPNSVTSIGSGAFYECSGLTSVTIGSGVTTIGDSVFKSCSSLTSVTINATTPPALDTNVFDNTNNCPIYVPASSVSAYKSAEGWSEYADRIQAIA